MTRSSFSLPTLRVAGVLLAAAVAGSALAQPAIIALGGGVPQSVTNNLSGTYYVGGSGLVTAGAARWTLTGSTLTGIDIGGSGGGLLSLDTAQYQIGTLPNTGPQIQGNTAAGVSPAFSTTPTLVPSTTQPATTEFAARRWNSATSTWQSLGGLPVNPALMVYGSGSNGSSSGTFLTPNAISRDGRYIVGFGYISNYNSAAGTTISANTFTWRPFIWDSQANAGAGGMTILPTPFRTSSNTWRRRTGNAYAVSNDGAVIVGAQEHNSSTGPAADPDGARPVVWRRDGSGVYTMTFLPNGVDGSGFPYTASSTPGTYFINGAGSLIVGRAIDNTGASYIAKWNWNAGTSSWDAPISIGSNLTTPASWLPASVTSCGVPPSLTPSGMSDDGNTIVGTAVYSTCGSFMTGGFIWTSTSGVIVDWYDYLSEQGVSGLFANYGPIGDLGDPNRGLPKLGAPTGISPDGSAVVGFQGGTQRIPGAQPWILVNSGGPACVAPTITLNPAATTAFSACTSSVILNVAASGTAPFTYQWSKDGQPIFDGSTGHGSTITGANSFQLRVNAPLTPADAGVYTCTVTGPCGSGVTTTNAVVAVDAAFPPAGNDTCAGAQVVSAGTNVLTTAQSPCAAYIDDPSQQASCAIGTKTDRWFSFTPSVTRDYRIETCGANYDTVVSVYDGCFGSELACNDNYTTGPSTGCNSQRSRIGAISLTAGTTYLIRIAAPAAAFLSSTSTLNFSISNAPAAAPNDNCFSPATAVVGTNALDTTEATSDGFAGCLTSVIATRDVWFTYTPSVSGTVRLATCPGTTWNTVLSVFDGCAGNELACNDNANLSGCSSQSVIDNFAVSAGVPYLIRVGGNSATAFGVGTLTVNFYCPADFNHDGNLDPDDLGDYITCFFSTPPCAAADFNHDTNTDPDDLGDFITTYFSGGCP